MSPEELQRALEGIIRSQQEDADRKLADSQYPRAVGKAIQEAAFRARGAIGLVPDPVEPVSFLRRALADLEAAHEAYRFDAEDEDGFGSATFHEIRHAVEGLLEQWTKKGSAGG